MMVPTEEFERLQNYYKGQISQSALLNKAGQLAAEKHLILKNPKIPNATAVRMAKPLAREQNCLIKQIRTGGRMPAASVGAPEEAMVDSPLEALLKRIIDKELPAAAPAAVPATPRTRIKKEPVAGPSGLKIKKESKCVKPVIPPKPSTSSKSTCVKKAALTGGAKALLKKIDVDPKFIDDDDTEEEDGGYSPKKKQKKYAKGKQSQTQKLWEGWEKPTKTKGKLMYDTDDSD